jgi:hypothetical protein
VEALAVEDQRLAQSHHPVEVRRLAEERRELDGEPREDRHDGRG